MGRQIQLATFGLILFALPAVSVDNRPNAGNGEPIFHVTVVERSMNAVNYRYRAGPTPLDFRGTVLLPGAKGEAAIESKRGRTVIDARFWNLTPPTPFGREYLTYVLWAITPEGRPHNLGEIIPDGSNKAKLHVTTDLQAFGLLATAEPYSAVRQPGDVVVLENQIRADTEGRIETIRAKYELLPRGHYTWRVPEDLRNAVAQAPKVSMSQYEALMELYQAENAVGIAAAANTEQYAPNTFGKARELAEQARQLQAAKGNERRVVELAREAAQTAEDARLIAQGRQREDRVREALANVQTAQQARSRAEAEAADARARASAARAEADSARAQAQAEREARQRAEAEASVAREQARRREQEAAALLSSRRQEEQQSAQQKALRTRLLEQMGRIAETRDTPRGLVTIISDSEFNGAVLRRGTADQMSRLADIITSEPGLQVQVEGHTDSAAAEALSWSRARAVGDSLIRQGLSPDRISTRGFGDSRPLVSNATAAGRRENRRVEVVIFGDPIGSLPYWDHTYTLTLRRR